MDSEIDLRPYFLALFFALLRRRRLIVTCAIGIAFIMGVVLLVLGLLMRSATADVLIVPNSFQVTLDPRFRTTDNQATNPTAQREGLINLASNRIIADQVIKELGDTELIASNLYQMVSVSQNGDILQITARDRDKDLALRIAQAWGKAYENLVIDTYSGSQFRRDMLTSEIDSAQQRYDQAQATLEKFLVSAETIKVQQQIANLTDLLNGSRQSQQQLYADYVARSRQVELILQDAQTLRDQVDTQGATKFANSFASLMLRIRMVDGAAPVFRMTAADITASETDSSNLSANLDQLVKVLSRRHDQLLAQSNEVASAITSGGVISTGLDTATRQRYIDQLASLNSTNEQLQAQQNMLAQQRDLARDALTLLQRKRAEQEVAQSSPQIEVRFIGASIDPRHLLSFAIRTLLSAVSAGFFALVLGTVLALFFDTVIPAILRWVNASKLTQPTDGSDTPADSAAQSS